METDKLNNKKIAIIGMGHMGKALREGLLGSGLKKENILVSHSSADNKKVAQKADWIIIAVKPSVVSLVMLEIKDCLNDKIIFSVVAGITVSSIKKHIGSKNQKIIRLMPNLPVAIGAGVIGLYANKNVSDYEKKSVIHLFAGLGTVIDCEQEKDLDAITILAGSGVAVVAYFVSLLEKSGGAFGLEKERAEKIAQQTYIGTLSYLQKTQQSAVDLQNAVATTGGVTEQIIKSLNTEKVPLRFIKSLEIGYAKIKKSKEKL